MEDPTLEISSGDISVLAEGGSQTFSFTCNYKWTATASDAWISVSPSAGDKGGGAVRRFADYDPIAVMLYFLAVNGIAMFCSHPAVTAVTLVSGAAVFIRAKKKQNR